jgi:hypothetical protein
LNCETRLLHSELINAKGKTLHIQVSLLVRREGISILISAADNLHRRFDAATSRVGHFHAQFAAIALAIKW